MTGAINPTAHVIEAGLMMIGLALGIATASRFYLMQWPDRHLVFSDTTPAEATAPDNGSIFSGLDMKS